MTRCVECGLCRNQCPVYLAVMKETASPRAKGMLLNQGKEDKIFYFCTLCGAHELSCPYKADLQILKAREKLVKSGVVLSRAKQMVNNIKNHGHPFRAAGE
ncbi:MAG TPA: 4Fe-4S dicluster domain-containing protein [Nanoarchaeota archaeon]|nr:4Fe-4S dicluster domain-containing protein [Nanoarchaeota archaeon]